MLGVATASGALLTGAPPAPADEAVSVPAEATATPSSGSRLDCEPAGCEVWRVDGPRERTPVADGEVIVYPGRDELTTYDAGSGEVLWRLDAPGDVALDPRRVAVADGRVAIVSAQPGSESGAGTRPGAPDAAASAVVGVHDAADGEHLYDRSFGPSEIQQMLWADGHLLVRSFYDGGPGWRRTTITALTRDGDVAWEREGVQALLHEDAGVLVVDGDRVVGIETSDGSERFSAEGRLTSLAEERVLLVSGDRDEVVVIDLDDGGRQRFAVGARVRYAAPFGPWTGVVTDDDIRVLDATGEVVLERSLPEAPSASPRPPWAAVDLGTHVAAVFYDTASDDLAVEVLTADGGTAFAVPLRVPSDAAGALRLYRGADDGEQVHLATLDGARTRLVTVDLDARKAIASRRVDMVHRRGDYLVVSHRGSLEVGGPAGTVQADGVRGVASVDPLVVHGVGGMLRLATGPLTGVGHGSGGE